MIKLSIIVAVANNFAIGKDNKLLYNISEDLKHFKELTTGHVVIMGQNTFDSLPQRPLKNRTNIVLCYEIPEDKQGAEWYTSIKQILTRFKYEEEIFVIGGASVYKQFLPLASKIYLTEINDTPKDFDVSFPEINYDDWDVTSLGKIQHDEKTNLDYRFITLERKGNSLIRYGYPETNDNETYICKLIAEYVQSDDCEGDGERWQHLRIESVDNGCAPFLRLSIPNEDDDEQAGYWSISDSEDIKKLINDFEKRLNYHENNSIE